MKPKFVSVMLVVSSFALVGNAWGQSQSGQRQRSSMDTFLQWSSEQVNQLRNSCGRWVADLERRWSDSEPQLNGSASPPENQLAGNRPNTRQDEVVQGRQPVSAQGMGTGMAMGTRRGRGSGAGQGMGTGTALGTGRGQGSGSGQGMGAGTAYGTGRGQGSSAGQGMGTAYGTGRGQGSGAGPASSYGNASGRGKRGTSMNGQGSRGQGNGRRGNGRGRVKN